MGNEEGKSVDRHMKPNLLLYGSFSVVPMPFFFSSRLVFAEKMLQISQTNSISKFKGVIRDLAKNVRQTVTNRGRQLGS